MFVGHLFLFASGMSEISHQDSRLISKGQEPLLDAKRSLLAIFGWFLLAFSSLPMIIVLFGKIYDVESYTSLKTKDRLLVRIALLIIPCLFLELLLSAIGAVITKSFVSSTSTELLQYRSSAIYYIWDVVIGAPLAFALILWLALITKGFFPNFGLSSFLAPPTFQIGKQTITLE
jgi:hypothetical protein